MKRLLTILPACATVVFAGVNVAAQINLTEFQPNTPIRTSDKRGRVGGG